MVASDQKQEPAQDIIHTVFSEYTPRRLRLLLVGNSALVILFALLACNTVTEHKNALVTVAHNAAPSVVAAHQIQSGVMTMDRSLTDELLSAEDPDVAALMVSDFEKGRHVASKNLIAAARNITYGESEEEPIERLQLALGNYEMHVQRTRDLQTAKSPELLESYRDAYDVVRSGLIPNVQALNKANYDVLEATYSAEESRSALECGGVLVIGLFVLGGLLAAQIYLARRFRRRLNAPLIVASILTAAFLHHLYGEVRHSAERLRYAKEDSYDSINAILTARSSIYAANAAQSRYMLDHANAAKYEKEFFANIEKVAKFTPGHDFDSSIALAKRELTDETQRLNIPGMTGALAEEFANIEYEGEGKAALETLIALNDFVIADQKMRSLARSGAREDALRVCLGYEPLRVKYTFARLDDALSRALQINEEHFEVHVKHAADNLTGLASFAQVFAAVIVFCIYLGVSPRLREYM